MTKTNGYKHLYDPTDEQNPLVIEIHEYEAEESGFKFDSVVNITIDFLRYPDKGSSRYCLLPKRYCNTKSIVDIQNTEDNTFFVVCFDIFT